MMYRVPEFQIEGETVAFMQHAHLARRVLDIGKWLALGNTRPAPVSLAPRGGPRTSTITSCSAITRHRAAATPDELSRYALMLLTCQPAELRDLTAALQSAEQAVARSGGRDPKSLQILAQAYLQNGDGARAADTQRRVASLASSAN